MAASIRSMSPSPVPSLRIQSLPPSRSSSPAPATPSEHHPQFYIDDEMAVFLVEGCLFRVHRFFLDRESKVFPRVSGLENAPGVIELGPEVTRFEFESLLDFIYNGMHTKYTPSLSEWIALLSISTRLEMTDIRNRAIAEIDKVRSTIEPVQQVVLAVTHSVPAWLPDAYTALCLRDAPITLREMKRIGDETMVLVAEAREAILKAKLESRNLSQASTDHSLARRIVSEVFWREERELKRLELEREARERLEREAQERLEREARKRLEREAQERLQMEEFEREVERLEREELERELERQEKEEKLERAREAKEKAARELELLELQEASGDSEVKVESRLHKKKKGGKEVKQMTSTIALTPRPGTNNYYNGGMRM